MSLSLVHAIIVCFRRSISKSKHADGNGLAENPGQLIANAIKLRPFQSPTDIKQQTQPSSQVLFQLQRQTQSRLEISLSLYLNYSWMHGLWKYDVTYQFCLVRYFVCFYIYHMFRFLVICFDLLVCPPPQSLPSFASWSQFAKRIYATCCVFRYDFIFFSFLTGSKISQSRLMFCLP